MGRGQEMAKYPTVYTTVLHQTKNDSQHCPCLDFLLSSVKWKARPEQSFPTFLSLDRGAWRATVHGSQRGGHDWAANTFTFWVQGLLLSFKTERTPLLESNHTLSIFSCFSSVVKSCLTLCDLMDCSTPGFTVLHYLSEFTQTHVYWVGDAIQPSQPLSPPSPPALPFPRIRVFSNELALCITWPKYQSFTFSTTPLNQYSELISFRIDWFDLLAVHRTLKSLQLRQHRLLTLNETQICILLIIICNYFSFPIIYIHTHVFIINMMHRQYMDYIWIYRSVTIILRSLSLSLKRNYT